MKILITGGCGFLGSNLASSFLQDGAEVIVIDALFRFGSSSNLLWLQNQALPGNFHFVQADLADVDSVLNVFRRYAPFDFVCHVGGQVAMTTSLSNPARDLKTNIIGTFNVLEAVRELSPDALIAYSSTNKVYGDLEWLQYQEQPSRYCLPDYPDGLDESLPLDFSTPYGCSKGSADQYVRDWSRIYGLKTVVFRHSSIFGGRQFATVDQGWIGWFCMQAISQQKSFLRGEIPEPFTISGSGKQVRDVLHSDDLVALYRSAYNNRDILNGEIFNIGGGLSNSLSLLELFDLLQEYLEIPALSYTSLPRRASDQDFFVASIEKAARLLKWKPQVSYRDGIISMIEWLKSTSDL